jgi:hypothetical protein
MKLNDTVARGNVDQVIGTAMPDVHRVRRNPVALRI